MLTGYPLLPTWLQDCLLDALESLAPGQEPVPSNCNPDCNPDYSLLTSLFTEDAPMLCQLPRDALEVSHCALPDLAKRGCLVMGCLLHKMYMPLPSNEHEEMISLVHSPSRDPCPVPGWMCRNGSCTHCRNQYCLSSCKSSTTVASHQSTLP